MGLAGKLARKINILLSNRTELHCHDFRADSEVEISYEIADDEIMF